MHGVSGGVFKDQIWMGGTPNGREPDFWGAGDATGCNQDSLIFSRTADCRKKMAYQRLLLFLGCLYAPVAVCLPMEIVVRAFHRQLNLPVALPALHHRWTNDHGHRIAQELLLSSPFSCCFMWSHPEIAVGAVGGNRGFRGV